MQGLHQTADLFRCACHPALLRDANLLAQCCREFTVAAGLHIVGEQWHRFPDSHCDGQAQAGGVTGMLLLAESHLAVHTWPERGGVTLDVFVCNFTVDNTQKAKQLMDSLVCLFQPLKARQQGIERGIERGIEESGLSSTVASLTENVVVGV